MVRSPRERPWCSACKQALEVGTQFCPQCGLESTPISGQCSPLTLAAVALERDDPESAIEAYEAALVDYPESVAAWLGAATAQARAGRYGASEDSLRRVLALDDTCAEAHAFLGMVLMERLAVDDARAELDRALTLAPESYIVRLKRGELLLRLGFARLATRELETALHLRPVDRDAVAYARSLLRVARERSAQSFERNVPSLPDVAGAWQRFVGFLHWGPARRA